LLKSIPAGTGIETAKGPDFCAAIEAGWSTFTMSRGKVRYRELVELERMVYVRRRRIRMRLMAVDVAFVALPLSSIVSPGAQID
jgi:hypothetical protein